MELRYLGSRDPPKVLLPRFLAPRLDVLEGQPNRFIMFNMLDSVPGWTATIALCNDDLYAQGFQKHFIGGGTTLKCSILLCQGPPNSPLATITRSYYLRMQRATQDHTKSSTT